MCATNECPVSSQTPAEEVCNVVTHGLGAVLAVLGALVLAQAAWTHGSVLHLLTSSIFSASWILLYTTSTLYHFSRCLERKARLRVLDHCAIFVVIAGSYGPFMAHVVGGWKGYTVWVVAWLIALFGSLYKLRSESRYSQKSVFAYIVQGWLMVILLPTLWAALSLQAMGLLVAGGLLFTLGAGIYARQSMPFNHALWHCFVLAGSACVYSCVLFCITTPTAG